MDEVGGAVERIDDPGRRRIGRCRPARLLGEAAVIREAGANGLNYCLLGGEIGGGHQVVACLLVDLIRVEGTPVVHELFGAEGGDFLDLGQKSFRILK